MIFMQVNKVGKTFEGWISSNRINPNSLTRLFHKLNASRSKPRATWKRALTCNKLNGKSARQIERTNGTHLYIPQDLSLIATTFWSLTEGWIKRPFEDAKYITTKYKAPAKSIHTEVELRSHQKWVYLWARITKCKFKSFVCICIVWGWKFNAVQIRCVARPFFLDGVRHYQNVSYIFLAHPWQVCKMRC